MNDDMAVYAGVVLTYATIFILAFVLIFRRKPSAEQVSGQVAVARGNRPSQWKRATRLHGMIAFGLSMFFVAHWRFVEPHITHIELLTGVVIAGAMIYHPLMVLRQTAGSQPRWWDFAYVAMLILYFIGTFVDAPTLLLATGIPVIFLNLALPVVVWFVERAKKVEVYLLREGYFFHYTYLGEQSGSGVGTATPG
ncbi:MAG: hypothetical protein AB1513_06820 [Pseudomonadota bacterium]